MSSVPPFQTYKRGPKGNPGGPGPIGPAGPPASLPADLGNVLLTSGTVVTTFAQLQTALALGAKRITVGANIVITANVTIPYECVLTLHPFKFIQGGAHSITWYGYLAPIRSQVFQGFTAGQVQGPFGEGTAVPEWWGLLGSNVEDGEHDLAINCAIGASILAVASINVSLSARTYWIKRPLDLRGTRSRIIGASASATQIWAQRNFTPDSWENSTVFAQVLPNMTTPFTAVANEGGTKIRVTTSAGGTTELYAGQKVTLTGSLLVPAYNGTWFVDSVVDHQTVILVCTFAGTSTGTLSPITLDSVMETGENSATSLIWIGSEDPMGGRSFFSGVEKVGVVGYYAVRKWPLKRVHAISWDGWVEEDSFVRNVNIQGFSGFGIGGESPSGVSTVNGLTVENFHIASGTRRGCLAVYAPQHANCLAFREGTINLGVYQEETRAGVVNATAMVAGTKYQIKTAGTTNFVAVGAANNNVGTEFTATGVGTGTGTVLPAYILEWPQFGCYLAGAHTQLDGIHVEGVGNAFHIYATGGGCGVTLNNCDHNHLCDRKMVYTYDAENRERGLPDLAQQMAEDNLGGRQAFLFHHACGISIGRHANEVSAASAYDVNATILEYRCTGSGQYLLRDWVYGVDFTGYEGRFPNALGRAISFYTRGIPYGVGVKTAFTSAASHAAGAKTNLTVASSAGFLAGATAWVLPRGTSEDYDYENAFTIDSIPDATHIVINKAWTDTAYGHVLKQGAFYNRDAPAADRTYFIGPIW